VSYDLAVWEGERPADDAEALRTYQALYERYIGGSDDPVEPTPKIRRYVEALLERWIDMTEDEDDISPWSAGPLMDEASGPFIYFAMRWSMCEEVSAQAARMADDHGLVCYDPQADRLRPTPEERRP
jgi:hypothetical protein